MLQHSVWSHGAPPITTPHVLSSMNSRSEPLLTSPSSSNALTLTTSHRPHFRHVSEIMLPSPSSFSMSLGVSSDMLCRFFRCQIHLDKILTGSIQIAENIKPRTGTSLQPHVFHTLCEGHCHSIRGGPADYIHTCCESAS